MAAGAAPRVVLPQRQPTLRHEGQHCRHGRAGHLGRGAGGAGGAVLASDQRPRQPSGRSGADPVRHAAYPVDACHALHLFVPLFPQLDVLSGGAGPCAGPYAPPGLGALAGRRALRRSGGAVCRLLSGSIRSAHPCLVGRCTGSAAKLWVLLKKKPPFDKGGSLPKRAAVTRFRYSGSLSLFGFTPPAGRCDAADPLHRSGSAQPEPAAGRRRGTPRSWRCGRR